MNEVLETLEIIGNAVEQELDRSMNKIRKVFDVPENSLPEKVCKKPEHCPHGMAMIPVKMLDEMNYIVNMLDMGIERVIFADESKKTIVLFADGTKQTATCQQGDVYSRETGVLVCMLKRIYGNGINDVLNRIADETAKAETGKSELVYLQKPKTEKKKGDNHGKRNGRGSKCTGQSAVQSPERYGS